MAFITVVVNEERIGVLVCGVSISRVCVVCYSPHHRVMSQARDDFEGFLWAHISDEEKVIVQVETSPSVSISSQSSPSSPCF